MTHLGRVESLILGHLPKQPSYFDIDLRDDYEISIRELNYIVNLMFVDDLIFIVKQEGGSWYDEKMLCAFSIQGFVRIIYENRDFLGNHWLKTDYPELF